MLIALGVVAIVLSIALPMTGEIRRRSQALECSLRIRQLGTMLHAYAGDFRDSYPVWVTPDWPVATTERFWSVYTNQYQRLFFVDRWLAYSQIPVSSATYRCPANQIFRRTGSSDCDFWGVGSMYADSGYLNPLLLPPAWAGKLGARPQRLGDVLFPSAKVGLFEYSVWHGWQGSFGDGANITDLRFFRSSRPGNIWLFDGHVASIRYRDSADAVDRSPVWYSAKILLTQNGSRGRDLK